MTHTAELKPWVCFYKSKYDEWHIGIPTDGRMNVALCPDGILPDVDYTDRERIAEQIVNSVNACAGIPDPAQLRADRDALLEWAESLDASWTELFPDGPDGDYGVVSVGEEHAALWRTCRALISRIRGEVE